MKLISTGFTVFVFLLASALIRAASPHMIGSSTEPPAITSTLTLTRTLTLTVTTTEATVVTHKITEQITVFSTEALLAAVLVLGLIVAVMMYMYSKRRLSGS